MLDKNSDLSKRIRAICERKNSTRQGGSPSDISGEDVIRVAFYDRFDEGLESQIIANIALEQLLDDHHKLHPNWKLVRTYIDHTGPGLNILKRLSLYNMVQDAKSDVFDVIVVRGADRIARSTREVMSVLSELWDCGVNIYFADKDIWGFSPSGAVNVTLMSSAL